jgi:hypothetical protein
MQVEQRGKEVYMKFHHGYFYFKGCKLIVTPTELENLIKDFHVIKENMQDDIYDVSKKYAEVEHTVFIDQYKNFYEKLTSGYKFVWETDKELFNSLQYYYLTHDEKFMDSEDKGNALIEEPLVEIQLFSLDYYNSINAVFSSFFYSVDPSYTMGIHIAYPKSYYDHGKLVKTYDDYKETETRIKVYKRMVDETYQYSKRLIIITKDGKECKTDVRISIAAIDDMRNAYFMKDNNCTIK